MFCSSSPSPLSAVKEVDAEPPRNLMDAQQFLLHLTRGGQDRQSLILQLQSKQDGWGQNNKHGQNIQVSSLKQSNQTHWNNRWKECSSNFYKLMAFWKPKHVIIGFSSDHLWASFLANSIGKYTLLQKALDQNSHSQDMSPYIPVKTSKTAIPSTQKSGPFSHIHPLTVPNQRQPTNRYPTLHPWSCHPFGKVHGWNGTSFTS